MKRFRSHFAVITILSLLAGMPVVWSQDSRDLETWTSAEFRYRPSAHWRLGIEGQLRLNENSSEVDAYFTEITGGYELARNLWLIGGFRLIRKIDEEHGSRKHQNHVRLHLDAKYSYDLDRWNLNARFRYQTRDELGVSNEQGDFADNYLRLKLGAGYNIRKWSLDPQISTEIFHHSEKNEEYGFNKFRVSVGTEYSFRKLGKLGLFYRYEHEINTEEPRTTDIIRIQYVYTLKGY